MASIRRATFAVKASVGEYMYKNVLKNRMKNMPASCLFAWLRGKIFRWRMFDCCVAFRSGMVRCLFMRLISSADFFFPFDINPRAYDIKCEIRQPVTIRIRNAQSSQKRCLLFLSNFSIRVFKESEESVFFFNYSNVFPQMDNTQIGLRLICSIIKAVPSTLVH